ncbi:O-antigen ligase family protein [Portibacter marinus]|uniref:O-antigen ligase family protein n=1 Tax=Portibacter marinus TaxID=2898660 RepID=UPI001F301D60|nr:O-antigen ligase family protein [Portibacter marinus]
MPVILLTLGFLPYLQGLVISDNANEALKAIQHNLAYLSLPLATILLPPFSKKQIINIIAFFIGITTLSTVPVLIQYGLDYESITASLGQGKAIPTPIDHVRYSIFLAIASVFSLIAGYQKQTFFRFYGRIIYFILGLYLFVVLHVLAVRSGLALVYIGLFLSGLLVLLQAKKYLLLMGLVGIVLVSPIIAYYTIPSFHKKIHYSLWDYGQQKEGQGANYSDSERMRSYQIGLEIWKDHPFVGIGTGDAMEEAVKRYEVAYPEGGRALLPHNQLIKFLTTSGLLGLLCFLIAIYGPFLMNAHYRDPYVLALTGMLTVSFMVEATLERSYMLGLTLMLFTLLYQKGWKKPLQYEEFHPPDNFHPIP